jgi:hypothetical protein
MMSPAFRALMTAHIHGECGPLTNAEAEALAVVSDFQLMTTDSDVRPGGTIRLSVLGEGLLSQLSDTHAAKAP